MNERMDSAFEEYWKDVSANVQEPMRLITKAISHQAFKSGWKKCIFLEAEDLTELG